MSAPLQYFTTASLDGFTADRAGRFDWAVPPDAVHQLANDLMGASRLSLFGRRMYEVMSFWEDPPLDELPPVEREFADLWRDLDKIVYSRTLTAVATARTTLRAEFDPDEVRRLKAQAQHPLMIGGGELASAAARAGLLDELHLVLAPVVVGGGTPFLSSPVALELVEQTHVADGFVYLRYRVR